MKCSCGADYEVIDHGLGYSIRCKGDCYEKENN